MTFEQIKELKILISQISHYYQKPLNDTVVGMYAEDLADLDFAAVKNAYVQFRRDPRNKFMPLPAQIREIVCPTVSDDTLAREASARIVESITRFGYMRGSEARLYIGEMGWNVVQRYGGWNAVCEGHGTTINPGQFLAQARDIAKAHIEMSRAGSFGEAPSLPEPAPVYTIDHKPKGLQQAASVDIFGGLLTKETEK